MEEETNVEITNGVEETIEHTVTEHDVELNEGALEVAGINVGDTIEIPVAVPVEETLTEIANDGAGIEIPSEEVPVEEVIA